MQLALSEHQYVKFHKIKDCPHSYKTGDHLGELCSVEIQASHTRPHDQVRVQRRMGVAWGIRRVLARSRERIPACPESNRLAVFPLRYERFAPHPLLAG